MDFACKDFKLEEVVRCSLGLTKGEYKVLNFLIKLKDEKRLSKEIAKEVNLDLSTTQRCLKKLHEKDIINRSQKNLNSGGYVFVYSIQDKTQIKKIISQIISKWAEKFHNEINRW